MHATPLLAAHTCALAIAAVSTLKGTVQSQLHKPPTPQPTHSQPQPVQMLLLGKTCNQQQQQQRSAQEQHEPHSQHHHCLEQQAKQGWSLTPPSCNQGAATISDRILTAVLAAAPSGLRV